MRWRRRPTTEQLRGWLADGSNGWVERWLDDPAVTAELDRLTKFEAEHLDALRTAVEPTEGFAERTTQGVSDRVTDLERVGVLLSLLQLGPRSAWSIVDPDRR